MAGFWNADEGETNFTQYSYRNLAEVELLEAGRSHGAVLEPEPFLRAGVAARFGAATWTGDIRAKWSVLATTTGDLLSYGLSDMPYSTRDIGGYSGNEITPELTTRWMEAGVFFPVMRSHSRKCRAPHFPCHCPGPRRMQRSARRSIFATN